MASYYDPPESRLSRRNDSYSRTRDEQYLKPTVGTKEPRRRSGERTADGRSKSYTRQPSPYRQRSDAKYDYSDYPPPVPPDTGRPNRSPQSLERGQSSWPPFPTCEDEAISLAKEAGTQHLLSHVGKDEAQSRGTINQEPIIEDVPEYINQDERRFVLASQNRRNADLPTPPTSEDEKARKARRRPSKLDMSFSKTRDSVPEMSKRPASPYAYSKPSTQETNERSRDQFLSHETLLSPPPADMRGRYRGPTGSRSQPCSPRRGQDRDSASFMTEGDYFSMTGSENAVDDAVYDRKKPLASASSQNVPWTSTRPSAVDSAPPPASMPIRRQNLDARRNTDTPTTLPVMSSLRVDRTRRPTPLTASSALSQLDNGRLSESPSTLQPPAEFPLPHSRDTWYTSSRPVSPAGSTASTTSAADATSSVASRRSPRASGEYIQNRSLESSPTASRQGSIALDSRPSSPSPRTPSDSPRLPRTDLDWGVLTALNAARRPKPASRLSTPLRQESASNVSRVDPRQFSSRNGSLPYPTDNGPSTPTVWMPSERTHQYFSDTKTMPQVPAPQDFQAIPRTEPHSLGYIPPAGSTISMRPPHQHRHSATDLPQLERRTQVERPKHVEPRRVSFTSSQAKKDIEKLAQKGLPVCYRTRPAAGYSDWYTLIGAPNLNFCPDCVDAIFERTVFRNSFRRSPPLNLKTPVVCALGGIPWIRLAWLMTLQQQRADLNLLKDIAEIAESHLEQCPGDRAAVRSWYGIRDSHGMFVRDFYICYSDVRKIESLFPTLHGLFVRHPYRVSDDKHTCAMRQDGNRFATYIDVLAQTHDKALDSRKEADPNRFVDTVKRRQRLRECTKDMLVANGLWHFIPSLPEFTVCEDCYESVIEPHVQRNNDLAMRFNRTIQPTYSEGIGNSCQLYSPRMRTVFSRAARDKDLKYLARKAMERRDNEVRLQQKYRQLEQKYKRLSWESGRSNLSEADAATYDLQVAEIMAEWKATWE